MELVTGKRYRLEFEGGDVEPMNIIVEEKAAKVVAGLWRDWVILRSSIAVGHSPYMGNAIRGPNFLKRNITRITEI